MSHCVSLRLCHVSLSTKQKKKSDYLRLGRVIPNKSPACVLHAPPFLGGVRGITVGGASTTTAIPLLLFAGFDEAVVDAGVLAAAFIRLSSTSLARLPRTSPRSCSLDPVHSMTCTMAMPRSRFISRPSANSLLSPCQCPSPTKLPPSSYTMYFLLKVWNLSLPSCHLFFLRRRSCVYRQTNSRTGADADGVGVGVVAGTVALTGRNVDC